MKIIFPSKRVEAPMLSEEQISKLMDGRYVEGEFGLDEGDSFVVRYGGERFEAFCYRMIDPGRCRIRRKGRGWRAYTYSETSSKPLLPLYDVLPIGNMAEMKCPSCGGTEFVPYVLAIGMAGEYEEQVDAFACMGCGRIEVYARKNILDRKADQIRQAQRIQEERKEIDAEIAVKEKELEELKKIIGDENQTVKNVREAKEKMVEVQNRINVLRSRKSSL